MKIRTVVMAVAVCTLVSLGMFEHSWAGVKAEGGGMRIGVVSVRKVVEGSKRNAKYMAEMAAEHNKLMGTLTKLSEEIESDEAVLKTLKPDSSDYLKQLKKVLENRGSLKAQEDYNRQRIEVEDRLWNEEFYREILRITAEVAKAKGLHVVFENSEPEFPTFTRTELATTIRVHKVLYSAGCIDITDDVRVRLDGGQPK